MGIMDKFRDLIGIEDYEDEEYEEVHKPSKAADRRPMEQRIGLPQDRDSKIIPISSNKAVSALTSAFKMVVMEPSGFEECPKLVDNLRAKKPIIINLERIESDVARKIFDFLSGATYALNGNVHKVANNIFVFAPENVDISANVENKGFSFAGDKKNHNPWG